MNPSTSVELTREQLDAMLQRIEPLIGADYPMLKLLVDTFLFMMQCLQSKNASIRRLRNMLFGAPTEKTRKVLKKQPQDEAGCGQQADQASGTPQPGAVAPEKPSKPRPGHGRNGAQDYPGADKVQLEHPSLKSGDLCPQCEQGKVYAMAPGVLVRITGQAPLQATVYELQKLRCNLCGDIYAAPAPAGINPQKYDARAASMIAQLKYGNGLPFYRLERLQDGLGMPLPASTQWKVVAAAAELIKPAFQELLCQAAQGDVLHNDDTTNKVLALMKENTINQELALSSPTGDKPRTGIFTTGIVSIFQEHTIALFFTGRQHAGENLAKLLAHRDPALGAPIQMCDALSRNLPSGHDTIEANCNSHARRNFVDVVEDFPSQCAVVLEIFRQVYRNDALCHQRDFSPEQRLQWHQSESDPLMQTLRLWLDQQFEQHLVEPNSTLGEAITYMRKRWDKLTLFLRKAGAPLDNNICERIIKMVILHRKNALFFKTQKGADVGDLFMSLIHTCQLCGINPFDYLTALQEHHNEVREHPAQWMPWNYQQTMARADNTSSVNAAVA
jgi:transposase